MADLSRDDVLKLARLARLELSEDEIESFRKELSSVLEYVGKPKDVDVSGLKPTHQVTGLTSVMRDDVIQDYGMVPEDLLRLAPKTQDGQIKVKRMIG